MPVALARAWHEASTSAKTAAKRIERDLQRTLVFSLIYRAPRYFGIYLNEFNLTGQMLGVRFAHLRYRLLVEHSAGALVTEMLPAVNELCIESKSPRQPVGSIGQRAFGLEEL